MIQIQQLLCFDPINCGVNLNHNQPFMYDNYPDQCNEYSCKIVHYICHLACPPKQLTVDADPE